MRPSSTPHRGGPARIEGPPFHRGASASKEEGGSQALICHLAFLEKLVQYRIFLFGIFVVLERLCKIVQCALSLPLLGIVFGDAVVGPRVLLVGLEGSIEGFVGVLHVLLAQRQPADRGMCRTEVRIGDEGRVILLLCQVQASPRFVKTSQREMHFCVLGVQA